MLDDLRQDYYNSHDPHTIPSFVTTTVLLTSPKSSLHQCYCLVRVRKVAALRLQ